MIPWWQQPFFQVALPIMITFALAFFWQNKRIDDLRSDVKSGFAEIKAELREIRELLRQHGERLARLEERAGIRPPKDPVLS